MTRCEFCLGSFIGYLVFPLHKTCESTFQLDSTVVTMYRSLVYLVSLLDNRCLLMLTLPSWDHESITRTHTHTHKVWISSVSAYLFPHQHPTASQRHSGVTFDSLWRRWRKEHGQPTRTPGQRSTLINDQPTCFIVTCSIAFFRFFDLLPLAVPYHSIILTYVLLSSCLLPPTQL